METYVEFSEALLEIADKATSTLGSNDLDRLAELMRSKAIELEAEAEDQGDEDEDEEDEDLDDLDDDEDYDDEDDEDEEEDDDDDDDFPSLKSFPS